MERLLLPRCGECHDVSSLPDRWDLLYLDRRNGHTRKFEISEETFCSFRRILAILGQKDVSSTDVAVKNVLFPKELMRYITRSVG